MPFWRQDEEPSAQERVDRLAREQSGERVDRPVPVPREEAERIAARVRPAEQRIGRPARSSRIRLRRSSSGVRGAGRTLLIVWVVLVFAVAAFTIVSIWGSLEDDVTEVGGGGSGDDSRSGGGSEGGLRSGGGSEGGSLIRRDRFARAKRVLAGEVHPEARVFVLRLAPDRLDAIVVDPSGRRETVQVKSDLSTTSVSIGSGDQRGIPLRRIPVAAPQRIVRKAARLSRRQPESIGYLALSVSPIDGEASWSVFFTAAGSDPPSIASLDGSRVRRAGEPP